MGQESSAPWPEISSTYRYTALPPISPSTPKTFRLLTIMPKSFDKYLRCKLHVHEIESAPPFEALSYVWGDSKPVMSIYLEEESKSISFNLGLALARLRLEDKERIVWIDALCINQDDLAERSQQVQLMVDIYTRCTRVVIWMGPGHMDDRVIPAAFRLMHKTAEYISEEVGKPIEKVCAVDIAQLPTETESSPIRATRDLPAPRTPPWGPAAFFFHLPWFRRMWIAQEVAFAPATVYIGKLEIDWDVVAMAASWWYHKGYGASFEMVMDLRNPMTIWMSAEIRGLSLDRFLDKFGHFEATDPRDKVYALLGFLYDDGNGDRAELENQPDVKVEKHRIIPDYTKEVWEVYSDAVHHIIHTESHGNLTQLFAMIRDIAADPDPVFPSWIPRWDLGHSVTGQSLNIWEPKYEWRASGDKRPEFRPSPDPKTLYMIGAQVTRIQEVFPLYEAEDEESDVQAMLLQSLWSRAQELLSPYPRPGSLEDAFVAAITGLRKRNVTLDSTPFNASDLAEIIDNTCDPEDSHFLIDGIKWYTSFFITDDGKMGVGSKRTQKDDVVCLLYGGRLPVVLRPTGDQWRFLEQCVVPGIMHGEAMVDVGEGRREEWFELR
ncbi:heterokaryon incompatibility protein-domain-containing protein [Rhexocercosporidium sp. MPI-PUGE-AT-0058]|nr:heterokaryon incompatibility protein-domain-containing protein [Rhexocercosporidium sp. MPI-PUGE-AT-0058]